MMEKNRFSAFFDGEKHCENTEMDQWLDSLSDDAQNLQLWKSFVLTREVMRDEGVKIVNWDIAEKVALALESEPCYQNDKQANSVDIESTNVTIIQQAKLLAKRAEKALPNWVQQVAQMGAAAAVAVVVILTMQHYNAPNATSAFNQQPPVLQTIPLSGEATPVSLSRETTLKTDETQLVEQRQRINELLQDFELQRRLNAIDIDKMNEEQSP